MLHNLSGEPVRVQLLRHEKLIEIPLLNEVFGKKMYESSGSQDGLFDLDGYGYRWLRVDGLSKG